MTLLDSVLASLTTSTVALGLTQEQLIKSGRRLEGVWNGDSLSLFVTGNIKTFFPQDAQLHMMNVRIYSQADVGWMSQVLKAKNSSEISSVLSQNGQTDLASIWDLFMICTNDSFQLSEYLDWLHFIPIPRLPKVAPWTVGDYWPVIIKYLARGDFDNALATLNNYQYKEAIQDLCLVIESYPDRKSFATFADYLEAWEVWKMRGGNDVVDPNFKMVYRILAGDKDEINRNVNLTWQEKLGAYCLFCSPTIDFADMEKILNSFLPNSSDNDFQDIQVGLLKNDFMSVLRISSKTDAWLVAHLADALVKENLLDEQNLYTDASAILTQSKFSIREWYILEFADSIFPLSWSLAFNYLLKCPIKGRKRISMYCTRLCPDQVNMADLEQFLLNNDFVEECRLLYAVAGRSFLSMNDLVNSLSFYAESKNAPRLFSTVLKFLESKPKLIDYENILAPINGSTLVSYDALVFLSRYRDFLQHLEAGSLKEAGDYITNLIFSGSIPRQFWKYAYDDIELILDNSGIDAPGCLELLRILEDEDPTPVIIRIRSKLIHQLSMSWK